MLKGTFRRCQRASPLTHLAALAARECGERFLDLVPRQHAQPTLRCAQSLGLRHPCSQTGPRAKDVLVEPRHQKHRRDVVYLPQAFATEVPSLRACLVTPSRLGDGCPDAIGARVRGKLTRTKLPFDSFYSALDSIPPQPNLLPEGEGIIHAGQRVRRRAPQEREIGIRDQGCCRLVIAVRVPISLRVSVYTRFENILRSAVLKPDVSRNLESRSSSASRTE